MTDTEVRRRTALLEVKDVAVHFGGVKAVDGITLEMRPGQIYGVLGPNGSGKSTLLGAMTRLTPLTRGRFVLDGHDYTKHPANKVHHLGIARTFQTVRLLDDRSVRDNILLGQDTLSKTSRKDASARVEVVMERVGVRDHRQAAPAPPRRAHRRHEHR
jgi:branched-chain amino acid transport system ATP-binding protein